MAKGGPSTGIDGLDADLRKLYEVVESGKSGEVKKAISDSSLTKEQVFEAVPKAIYRLALGLRNPRLFRSLIENAPREARSQLEDARRIIEDQFVDILKHPAVVPQLGEESDESDQAIDHLNEIMEVTHIAGWAGAAPRMRPFSRLVFLGKKRRVLLDSACDWDDLLFLAATIAGILACEMKGGKQLAELKMIAVPRAKMKRRIRQLEENIEKIKRRARLYGVRLDDNDSEENNED